MPDNNRFPVRVERLSPYGENFFFGYYDLNPWDAEGSRHLAARPTFIDRLQKAEDEITIGYFDIREEQDDLRAPFRPIAVTKAWNFQQSCMLQWHPACPERKVIFNTTTGHWYAGTVLDVESGEKILLDQPVATVAPDGKKALSINFARMYSFRPGYGYATHPDPWYHVNRPSDDGVHLVDLTSGASSLLVSLADIWSFASSRHQPVPGRKKILINHITWNSDGTRFLFLMRYLLEDGKGWVTTVIVSDADGTLNRVLIPFGHASHYWWTGPDTVIFYSDGPLGRQQYEYDVTTGEGITMNTRVFREDTHMRTVAGTSWIINDTYPRQEPYRRLFLFNRESDAVILLGRFYSPPAVTGDIRCDLHPRVSPDGRTISFDSVHEGFRGIYSVDISALSQERP